MEPARAVVQGKRDPAEADALALQIKDRFSDFIKNFSVSEINGSSQGGGERAEKDYLAQVTFMKDYDQKTMFIDFTHLRYYDEVVANAIAKEYYRFDPYIRRALKEIIREYEPEFATTDGEVKEFFVSFFNLDSRLKVRDLKTGVIGSLIAIQGTVTRTSEVRPELMYGVFQCDECGAFTGQVEQQFKFTEPKSCHTAKCGNRTKWTLDVQQSIFVDWQRVRVQENADEIPPGSMPRSVDVILRHAAVEQAKAGDKCTFTGTLIVVPDVSQLYKAGQVPKSHERSASGKGGSGEGITGLKALGVRDLTYRTAFLANSVSTDSSRLNTTTATGEEATAKTVVESMPEAERAEILAMSQDEELYTKLARSIAPTVFGHDEVKRGILLMLLGGVLKRTPEGIRLRGDINVCIVGDPSTAKSQFLKYTCKFVPRAVYTSGKASSAAGLTASVAKDPDTGEFAIEAGALMLADNGVCCIDEFDKMDPTDQVAIHEAMEQQTISITKAGIQATLNARTSILAAANPIYGRYDRSKALRHNIALSPAIMSRFDLFFVVLDELDGPTDAAIARHIVNVHQHREAALKPPYDIETVQKYVAVARLYNPIITRESRDTIVSKYQKLRQADVVGASQTSYRITVRQLESMVRLSEALARMELSETVNPTHVNEAYRLLQKSIIHVESSAVSLRDIPPETKDAEGEGAAASGEEGKGDDADEEITLEYEKFERMSRQIGMHLRHLEDTAEGTSSGGVAQGITVRDLVFWYLETNEPESPAAAARDRTITNLVIKKLVEDGMLYYVQEPDKDGDDEDAIVALSDNWTL